jgi:hypothetical protein
MLAGDYPTRQRLLELTDELIEALRKFSQRRAYYPRKRFESVRGNSGSNTGRPLGRDEEFWLGADAS